MARDNLDQSASISQIALAVGMYKAHQQNAVMVEQTVAAARNLKNEVDGLAEQAARFRTGVADGARL